jgi:hypothetical protein
MVNADIHLFARSKRGALYYCSLCAPKTLDQADVRAWLNTVNPTGVDFTWHFASNLTLFGGEPNPHQCHDDPDRLHYLFVAP